MPVAAEPQKKRKHYADEITKQNVEVDYIAGRGSCAELAKRYGLNPQTVASWQKRGAWKKAAQGAAHSVAQRIDLALSQRADTMAERATQFLERCARESESWLDTVQTSKALVSPADIASVAQLINAWKVPVAVGRQTYGLDTENQANRVQIAVYSKDGVTLVDSAQTPPQDPAEQDS